ncbi:MAG: tRNA glutamyl-Q(34) synthetase GluQRS [Pseudomonadota bacterium]
MVIERFAPSPTGLLHLGHAFSAWCGWTAAQEAGGRFLLRIEDLDTGRVRQEYEDAIFRDLTWLGLDWPEDVLRQSTRRAAYETALADFAARKLTYRCTCTRRDIREAMSAPQENTGPDGPVYPGTCRGKPVPADQPHAIRLDMDAAIAALGGVEQVNAITYQEIGDGAPETGQIALNADWLRKNVGDFVLGRRDGALAYHLAVVIDDAFQNITHITRGADLVPATPIHRLLQALLDLPTPVYRHHRLIRDSAGKRLAKRDDARSIAAYRDQGLSPAEVLALTA